MVSKLISRQLEFLSRRNRSSFEVSRILSVDVSGEKLGCNLTSIIRVKVLSQYGHTWFLVYERRVRRSWPNFVVKCVIQRVTLSYGIGLTYLKENSQARHRYRALVAKK